MQDTRSSSVRVLFLGTPSFAAIPLEALANAPEIELVGIVTQPDRPVGRRGTPQPPPVRQRALELGLDVPVLQPATLRDEAVAARIAALRPDVGVVAAYGEILRRHVLELPLHGYLNIHPSLLPLYRGPTPVAGALLAGDAETGVTVMKLAAKMDAGPILAQKRIALSPDDRAGPLTDRLFELGARLLLDVLPAYVEGTLVPQPQDDAQATYTHLLTRQHGTIDWKQPAVQVERMIRAYDPWPGAFTMLAGQPVRMLRARVLPEALPDALPGRLVARGNQALVATGEGTLVLDELQPSGKRAMRAIDWLRGVRLPEPIMFGAEA